MTKPIDRYTDLLRQGGLPEVYVLMAEHAALTQCQSAEDVAGICEIPGPDLLWRGFSWSDTKDGHAFWHGVVRDWEHHLNHMIPL